ncbi:DMT family protein [Streptomyces justiciae]|uniref:hypothetical protein n=1 Tax=Streptomyces justiciae TaxID=2780140 RepID=UPI001D137F2C|nr:hypothetical protein [Streptomyces justiciae]
MNIMVAVVLALASIAAYAAAAATQHHVASTDGNGLRRLLASPAWWASNAANATGAALHVAALKYGPLTLVQCLGALTVTAAMPLAARGAGRRVSRGEWHGMALTLPGFAALLPLTATGGDSTGVPTTPAAPAVAVTASLVIPLALSVRTGTRRTLALAAASGIASGTGSALTQTVLHTDCLLTWQTSLVAVPVVALAVAGLLLSLTGHGRARRSPRHPYPGQPSGRIGHRPHPPGRAHPQRPPRHRPGPHRRSARQPRNLLARPPHHRLPRSGRRPSPRRSRPRPYRSGPAAPGSWPPYVPAPRGSNPAGR